MLKVKRIDISKFAKSIDLVKGQRLDKAVRQTIDKVAEKLYKDMKPDVPRDTSELLNSWKVEHPSPLTARAGLDIVYAMYQHQGRRADGSRVIMNRPAGGKTFFMKLAVDKNFSKYHSLYRTELQKFLKSQLK